MSSYSSLAAKHLNQRHGNTYKRYYTNPQLEECYNKDQLIEQVHTTFPWCRVDKVHNVYATHMYGLYLLRREEIRLETGAADCEMTLYHVTTEQRAKESLEHGLDWRRTKRSRFGRGVSFSDDADYADYFADNRTGEVKRVIMVCTVLVHKTSTKIVKPNSGLSIPPENADTTMSPNGRVYVKYNDYEFYPLHFVYYERRLEDLSMSRYFNKNHKNNFKNGQLLPTTAERYEHQRQNELLRRQKQQKQDELLRRQRQRQNEFLKQQEQKRYFEQTRRQEQQRKQHQYNHQLNIQQRTRNERNNGCLIL
ncbi:uncharacterized protein LOC112685788 isoform X2 [Sipha flava]|nr:uncharacterized protein LOC112685788 isoform X2 [Sipha flava]XP_025413584.1 uncharacterized protein LOC112685788 isoform X2 [Sipha flava]XP_025413592.1 uncharacterized protein LOC112685788 isoform X2 [Sipha flava]XP_025413599.1 uncharacterized protein LOC112685788 isoform X2 [Sipha flava]XP_025413603.1 uncharacterized protein LOC112685788 isoform X2 [Sipha flava]